MFPDWGDSPYHNVTLSAETNTLSQLLVHLYVLLPALDNNKHYWINQDETDKLLRFGQGWLDIHPARNLIMTRYLGHRSSLVDRAMEQFAQEEPPEPEDSGEQPGGQVELQAPEQASEQPGVQNSTQVEAAATSQPLANDSPPASKPATETDLEKPANLQARRIQAIMEELRQSAAASVLDLGCGAAQLITHLIKEEQFTLITGVEVSLRAISRGKRELKNTGASPDRQEQVKLLHGSITYRDPRLEGMDAAVAMEVIEHLDLPKLDAFEDAVLAAARPGTLIITTPNREYNVLYETLDRPMRHRDHRFEWTREEFQQWADAAAARNGYSVRYQGIGDEHPEHGHPTQMAVLSREPVATSA